MAIQLGGLSLNPNLVWSDKNKYSPVEQLDVRTINGGLVVRYGTKRGGRPITLEATTDQGWLTTTMVETLQTMANSAGSEYTLVLGSQSFRVVFRHQDPPALDVSPLIERIEAETGDWHTGTIKLFTLQ